MHFSLSTYSRLKSRIRLRYKSRYQATLKHLKQYPQSKTAKWMRDNHVEFRDFTPQRWFYLQQVENLLFFFDHNADLENTDIFTDQEDQVFEKWNKSEFADIFLKYLNKRIPFKKASASTAKIFDEHLVSLGNLHLLKTNVKSKNYRVQPSLGDIKKKNGVSKLLETTLHLDGKELVLLTSTLNDMKAFSTRIEVASKIIKHFSPDSWVRFSAFTEIVIPIKQEELVSYSHQELPGTSMINLFHRDFVDLLDDLLHENGHHHLNYYLNLDELIQEPVDCIYYSPWRRTLRPLRGIYHAYFTFFWAFKLFSDMAKSKELDSIWYLFSDLEKEKITWRAVEEYWMLDYSFGDLQMARKQGLITKVGWDLILEQRKYLLKFKLKITSMERSLKKYKSDLKNLKKTLTEAKKKYRLN
jgi:hypothetical protein